MVTVIVTNGFMAPGACAQASCGVRDWPQWRTHQQHPEHVRSEAAVSERQVFFVG